MLPVYNAEKYISESICSILEQTFTNFELIIINDGSSDATLEIVEGFKKLDKRVILVTKANTGLADSLNVGIKIARGKWIARMDSDDVSLPNRFEKQLQWLNSTGADIAGSWVKCFGTLDKRVIKKYQTDEGIKIAMLFSVPFAHPSVMMKTDLLRQLGYDEAYQQAQDYDLWERAIEAGWKMTNVPEVLIMYRLHKSQISQKKLLQQRQFALKIQLKYWRYFFKDLPIDLKLIDSVLDIYGLTTTEPDMDIVEIIFLELLRRNHGEARAIVLEHSKLLYIKAAAYCPDIVSRWTRLHREFGEGLGVFTKFNLAFLSFFRIKVDSIFFLTLKKIYIWMLSR